MDIYLNGDEDGNLMSVFSSREQVLFSIQPLSNENAKMLPMALEKHLQLLNHCFIK